MPLLLRGSQCAHCRQETRQEHRGEIRDFLRDLESLPVRIVPSPADGALMSLARQRNLTVYDAAYLELAMRERLPLATLDRALEKAADAAGVALFGAPALGLEPEGPRDSQIR